MKPKCFKTRMILMAALGLTAVACGDGAASTPSVAQPALEAPSATMSTEQIPTDTPAPSPTRSSPTAIPSQPPPSVTDLDLSDSGCEAVAEESSYCFTMSRGEIQVVGLDSGELCPIVATDAPLPEDPFSSINIARLGADIYLCTADGILRISIADGNWEIAGAPCNAVTSYDGGLMVDRWWFEWIVNQSFEPTLIWYPDYAAARQGIYERAFGTHLGVLGAIAAHRNQIYSAWHSASSIDVDSLTENAPLGVLTLEGFDDWIGGLALTEDARLVLIGGITDSSIIVFDANDGRSLQRHELGASIAGLACVVNESPATDSPTPTPSPTAASNVTVVPTATPCPGGVDCPARCPDADAEPPLALHELPPSIDTNTRCGNDSASSNYALAAGLSDVTASEELHVIGIYEGVGYPGFGPERRGVVDVLVHPRPKPVALALSSYGQTHWRISLAPGAELSRVLTQGYGEQTVEGVPHGVPIVRAEPCAYTYGWEVAHNEGGGGHQTVIAHLRELTGLRESSFQGCYDGVRFEVPHWSGDPPLNSPTPISGDETVDLREVDLPGCDSVVSQSQYCLTATNNGIAAVGLDTGEMCSVTATSAPLLGGYGTSFAWRGELLYACTYEGLVRVSLLDGSWEKAQVACDAVVDYDGGILLLSRFDQLRSYPDYQAVLDRAPSRTYSLDLWGTRIAVQRDRIYNAWHSTDTIEIADLDLDVTVGPLALEDYDTWIWGLAVTDDARLVVTDGLERLVVFDVDTGARLQELMLPEVPIYGLRCLSRAPAPGER